MMPSSLVSASTCFFTLVVTASRSSARLSSKLLNRPWSSPCFRPSNASDNSFGSCCSCSMGNWAALIAPQSSWPKTTSTLTFKWCTAYCSEAVVVVARQLPATRTTKMLPKPWSKMSSGGTRESAQLSTATVGNCFEMSARRSKAEASGRDALPIQKRALPRWSSASTSRGDIFSTWECASSARLRASSMEKPPADAASPVSSEGGSRRLASSPSVGAVCAPACCVTSSSSSENSAASKNSWSCALQAWPNAAPVVTAVMARPVASAMVLIWRRRCWGAGCGASDRSNFG
mmetsp:Transcript_114095/g.317434  ORF Transcript_114095/g.317434 Transcript_114095/m.317434 type:complete len:290 (-) Transcript_114095:3-872(-)